MCHLCGNTKIHKRNGPEAREVLDSINRPMRFNRNKIEPIARRFFAAMAREHMKWFAKVLEALPTPSLQTLRRDEKAWKEDADLSAIAAKAFPPSEIRDINATFRNEIGAAENRAIDEATTEFNLATTGETPAPQIGRNPAVYDWAMFQTILAAGQEATRRVRRAFARMSQAFRTANPLLAGPYIVDTDQAWVKELFRNGFRRVRDGMTRLIVPQMKQFIVEQVRAGQSWDQIARDMNKKFGGGRLWHWNRLVRTEMVIAINETTLNRYKELGVEMVKYSAASNACPDCEANAKRQVSAELPNGTSRTFTGVYPIDDVPSIPVHPHCRCITIPVFRLTGGAVLT